MTLKPLRQQAMLESLVVPIEAGDTFKPDDLDALEANISGGLFPYPDLLRTIALVRMRQAELSVRGGDSTLNNPAFAKADLAVKDALAVAPSDTFLWFGASWVALTRYQAPEIARQALAMSYLTGEHEGWVAARRSPIAIMLLPSLSRDLQDKMLAELQNFASTENYLPLLAGIIAGSDASYRGALLQALAFAPEDNRKTLAKYLAEMGVDEPVPGVSARGTRPWN